jgi:hypothetical protein
LNITVRVALVFSLSMGLQVGMAWPQEAQGPVISTERPTVGYSPDLIPSGSLQVENGAGASFQRNQYVVDVPETLLRVGLGDRAEVRYLFSDEVYQRSDTLRSHSFQTMDPALSIKLRLGKPGRIYPRSAVMGLSFPRGGSTWTSGSYDPSVTGIWTQAVKKAYFINEIAGGTLTTLAGARRMSWAPSAAGGRSLSETVTGFAEYAPILLANGSLEYILDGGFTVTLRRLNQLDIRTGYLSDTAGFHALFSIGYSIRRDGLFEPLSHLCYP